MAGDKRRDVGFAEGLQKGQRVGLLEGHNLGFDKGSSLGEELGFYMGYAETVSLVLKNEQTKPRVKKCLTALRDMISEFPLEDVMNQTLFDELGKIRAKYKQLSSLMGFSIESEHLSQISF